MLKKTEAPQETEKVRTNVLSFEKFMISFRELMRRGKMSIEILKKSLAQIRITIELFSGLTLFIMVFDVSAPDMSTLS